MLGRIAAQTAKQVIFQKVREAERENIFAEYNERVGEVINSTVKRFETGDLIVEIGRIEAVLPAQGAVARRKLHAGRAHPGRDQGRQSRRQGAAESSCRAPTRRCSSSCSSRKCRKSTTARS